MLQRFAYFLTLALLVAACGAEEQEGAEPATEDPAGEEATETETEEETETETSEPAEETVELIAAAFAANGSAEALVFDTYLDIVEEEAGGAVTFERFYQEAICSGPEMAECVQDGRVDVGQTIGGYTPALFPFAELISRPFQSSNAEAISIAYQDLMAEYPEIEEQLYEQGRLNAYHIGVEIAMIGGDQPLEGPEDLQGLTVRSVGAGIESALIAAGAQPIGVTASEIYEGHQQGVLDVWLNLLSGAADYNLNEVTTHWYEPGMGVYVNNVALINEEAFASAPAAVQDAFATATERFIREGHAYSAYSEGMEDSCVRIIEGGGIEVWEQWDDETVAEWRELTGDGPVVAWKSSVETLTDDVDGMYDRWLELIEEAEAASDHVSLAVDCMDRYNEQS